MQIASQLPQKISNPSTMVQGPREAPGEREPDGDSDDTSKVAAQQKPVNQIQSDTLGKKINTLV
jgi:hypothetical protein